MSSNPAQTAHAIAIKTKIRTIKPSQNTTKFTHLLQKTKPNKKIKTDPLLIYLKKINKVNLLNHSNKQNVAQQIKKTNQQLFRILLSTKFEQQKLLDITQNITKDQQSFKKLFPKHDPQTKHEHNDIRHDLLHYIKTNKKNLTTFQKTKKHHSKNSTKYNTTLTILYHTI